ncbi:MAG TPA: TIGR03118 family protein, partial [Mycobacteriales bacterium]|nr:TIGR03118 family protein [Mycobacteriales bacterium]
MRNLVSDGFVPAEHTDAHLVNGWGIAAGPSTPWWVADNGTDVSTLYDGNGIAVPLVVSVEGGPTGAVFNGSSEFVVNDGAGHSGPSLFMFASENGTIHGWNPAVPPPPPSTHAFVVV